ncbi:MAG: HD domain-containing protein [Treponema sp.]|nr:HD domain-containing protein [Treponema sp.]
MNNLFSKLKKRYETPKESKLNLSIKNLKILKIVLYFLIIFGASFLLIQILESKENPIYYIYYGGMFFLGLISILLIKFISRFKNYYVNQSAVIFIITLFLGLFLLSIPQAKELPFSSITIFYTVMLGVIIFFDITPIFHIIFILVIIVISDKALGNFSIVTKVNNLIYCACALYFALYKRKLTVQNERLLLQIAAQNRQLEMQNIELERQKDTLLLNKKYLENTVFNQSQKIQLQKERLIRIQNKTIISLSNLVENRDEDTGDHTLRTRDYVGLIAMKVYIEGKIPELTEEDIKLYIKAAPMHDIGKICVPDAVLKKPGKLTPDEFDQIKLHTIKGEKIVEEVLGIGEDEKYVKIAKEIALSHHEKYDGSGYPYGLKGEKIPLSARIMAIADVFDALVSPRCYKAPFSLDKAFEIIENEAGTHFDPLLAKAFVESKEDVIKIFNKYQNS